MNKKYKEFSKAQLNGTALARRVESMNPFEKSRQKRTFR
jgi:hypothetical protein